MTFGERFRQAREQQGLSLEAVEEETKIRKLYLQAIENDDFALLPPRVYAVGFVKRYARLLGIEEDEITADFKILAYGNIEEEELQPVVKPVKSSPAPKNPVKNVAAGVLFLILAVWAGYYLVGYVSKHNVQNTPVQPPTIEEPADKSPVEKEPEVLQKPELVVKLKAIENCWLYVKVDGKDTFSAILPAGQEKAFTGKSEIYIKAGNAGGIEVSYNGENIGILGKHGEVKEETFVKK